MPTLWATLEQIGMYVPEVHAGVRENIETDKDGQMRCKHCGAKVAHPRAAAAHLAVYHREKLEAKAIEAREFSQGKRKKLAKSGAAMPGGGFPIVNKEDLGNARRAVGRAKNPGAAKAHIRERAKTLGVKLPAKWQANFDKLAMGHKKRMMKAFGMKIGKHRMPNPSHKREGRGSTAGHHFPNASHGRISMPHQM